MCIITILICVYLYMFLVRKASGSQKDFRLRVAVRGRTSAETQSSYGASF